MLWKKSTGKLLVLWFLPGLFIGFSFFVQNQQHQKQKKLIPNQFQSKGNIMAIFSNTASYTPPANLNTAALTVAKVQPASVFNSNSIMSVSKISSIFSGTNSIALAPSNVIKVPATNTLKVDSYYTSKAPTTLAATAPANNSFMETLGGLATGVLNLGANVLLEKYGSKIQPATVESQSSSTPDGKTASPAVQIFQNGESLDTGFNALLQNLGNAFLSQKQQQLVGGGTVTTTQPSVLTYVLIGAVVLVIVFLLRRK